ncbi:MAG TPA: GIY-YIG nuclease family protein [Candidatus Paceibacterota bacterium]|nr:GIY-YIG nuclease family protein [Candidatus Paceibacterota bacterium]
MPKQPTTYILECADKTLYVGSTNALEKRLHEHNHSKNGAHYTKIRRPVVLKYTETFATLGEARSREAELKRLTRKKKLGLIRN